jgi:hypothetical protein
MSTTTTEAPVTFTATTLRDYMLREEVRMVPARPATVNDYLDGIWRGELLGWGEEHFLRELVRDRRMLDDVRANRIRPEKVIGRGVLKPKTSAIRYLEQSIIDGERALLTRGRSVRLNIDNATSFALRGHAEPHRAFSSDESAPTPPNHITPDPQAEAEALAYWRSVDKRDGGTYNHDRALRTVAVCGRCIDYADEAAVVWFDNTRGEFIHRGNDDNRCPGQGDDDTDDRCEKNDVERVDADLWSHESLDHWQRHGQYLPARAVGLNAFEVTAVRVTEDEARPAEDGEAPDVWGIYVTYTARPTMHVADFPTSEEAEQVAGKLAERFGVTWTHVEGDLDTESSASRQSWIETGRYLTRAETAAQAVEDAEPDRLDQLLAACWDEYEEDVVRNIMERAGLVA